MGGEIVTDQIVAAVYDGSQFQMVSGAASGIAMGVPNTINELRLSLQTGTPITSDTISGAPPSTSPPIPVAALRSTTPPQTPGSCGVRPSCPLTSPATTSYPWDMFLYDDSGTLTLTALEWSDGDTRATAIVLQDGVYVQSGAPNYRWVGSFIGHSATATATSTTSAISSTPKNGSQRV